MTRAEQIVNRMTRNENPNFSVDGYHLVLTAEFTNNLKYRLNLCEESGFITDGAEVLWHKESNGKCTIMVRTLSAAPGYLNWLFSRIETALGNNVKPVEISERLVRCGIAAYFKDIA